MLRLIGYRIKEEISKNDNSSIYRGTRESDNCPVVIKLLNREYPTFRELSAFAREYEIMSKLSGDGIIKAYSMVKYNNSLAIIMEDIGGESISGVLQSTKTGIAEKLSLAIKMTHALIQTHQQNIIHKDVNPTNFIWNYGTNQVKIIDFGISTELIRESSRSIDLNVLEGTINYMSPEQTGRINRPIDCRTDLYSLGVTFYELFTGQLPFTGEDESEIVYGHIAIAPIPPKDINPDIPAEREHPLAIFLDDLQWSDAYTLELLKYILEADNAKHIYLIGAYRDNEVQDGHPLLQLLNELKSNNVSYRQITLNPLEPAAVNHLISDTLHCLPDETESLTRLILHKTKGNPFFIDKLLNTLYFQGSFTFLPERRQWDYDLEKVEAVEISENVVELLVKSLESLPEDTLDILKMAACIGNQFDLKLLSQIGKKSAEQLGRNLWIAIEKEIILPLNNNYRLIRVQQNIELSQDFEVIFCFAHDRIRQAAQSLIPEDEKRRIHLSIGREYIKIFNETNRADSVFDLVNHLNIGRALIQEENERAELSYLNAIAGNKARQSGAFATAARYFDIAESLLTEQEWKKIGDKLFNLKLDHATCALLSGDFPKADELCEHLTQLAATNISRGAVSNVKVQILEFQGRFFEAIAEIRQSLLLFDIVLPEDDQEIGMKIQEGVMKMKAFLAETPVEELVNLPEMKAPDKIMVMQLLFQVVPPALQTNPPLYILASLMMFEMTCTYGTSPFSCKCFTDCGIVQATMLKDYKTSYKLGEAAFSLINKFNAEDLKPAVYFGFTFCSYWRTHYAESLKYYDMAYRKGLETGDIQHAAYALSHKVHLWMWVGKDLTELKQETENAIAVLVRTKTAMPLLLTKIVYYVIKKFQTIPEKEVGTEFEKEDQDMIVTIENTRDLSFLFRFFQYNTYENIILGNMEAAEKWNTMAEQIIFAGLSDFPVPDHYLFRALILSNKWRTSTAEEKLSIREALADIQQIMKVWAENCPDNFAHKYDLLSAEIAIIENEPLDTVVGLFKKAMSSIGNSDFIQLKALIHELYGKFWLDRGDETTGKAYIREARYLYRQWGAYRKVALLEKQYSQYFMTEDNLRGAKGTISTTAHNSIDVISILKSTQAISSEIKIDKLLTILIRTMIENAGAQRGCLLLRNEADGELYIEALQDVNSNRLQVLQSLIDS